MLKSAFLDSRTTIVAFSSHITYHALWYEWELIRVWTFAICRAGSKCLFGWRNSGLSAVQIVAFCILHGDVIKWKRITGPSWGKYTGDRQIPFPKDFALMFIWTRYWTNKVASDLRRHDAHVMLFSYRHNIRIWTDAFQAQSKWQEGKLTGSRWSFLMIYFGHQEYIWNRHWPKELSRKHASLWNELYASNTVTCSVDHQRHSVSDVEFYH